MPTLNGIAPLVTDLFVNAMIWDVVTEARAADGLIDQDVAELQHQSAMELKAIFLALYPDVLADPYRAYTQALRTRMLNERPNREFFDAAESLWLTAEEDLSPYQRPSEPPVVQAAAPVARPMAAPAKKPRGKRKKWNPIKDIQRLLSRLTEKL